MKTKLSAILLVFTSMAINASAAASALPAPLPQFMDQQQLSQWSAEKASATRTAGSSEETSIPFYTGKPYVAEVEGYVFKYRIYSPEMSRWTTEDPSGFPDGANSFEYAKGSCVGSFDPDGCNTQTFTDTGSYSIVETYELTYPGSGATAANPPTIHGTPVLSGPSSITPGIGSATLSQPNPGNAFVTNEVFTPADANHPGTWTGTYSFQLSFTWTAGVSFKLWNQTIGAAAAGSSVLTFTTNWEME